MKIEYDHSKIEKDIQSKWDEANAFTVKIDNENASSISYGVQTGVGYHSSDKVEFFIKINRIIADKLDFSTIDVTNTNSTSVRIGARFAF